MYDFFRSELKVEIFRSFFETIVLDTFPFISFKNSKLILSFFWKFTKLLTYLEPPLIPISMGYKKDIITG